MVVRVPTDIKARSAIEINGTSYAADARIKVQDLEFLGRTNALSALLSKGTLYPTYGTSRNLDMPNGHPGPVVLPVGVVQALLAAETTQDSPAILTSLVATVVDQWDDPDNTFTATEASASIAFTDGSDGGYTVANLEYKVGSAAWAAFDPADFTTPVVVEGLPVGATRSVRLRAVNAAGTGPQSDAVSVVVPAAVTAPTLVAATFAADELTFTYTGGTGATKLAIRVGQADLTQSPWVFVDSPPALDGDVTIPFVPAEYGDGTILDPVAQNLRVRLGNEVSSVQSGNFVAITAP